MQAGAVSTQSPAPLPEALDLTLRRGSTLPRWLSRARQESATGSKTPKALRKHRDPAAVRRRYRHRADRPYDPRLDRCASTPTGKPRRYTSKPSGRPIRRMARSERAREALDVGIAATAGPHAST